MPSGERLDHCETMESYYCPRSVDYGNTKTPSMHHRLGVATLSQLAFLGESNSEFPWKKSRRDNPVVKSEEKKRVHLTFYLTLAAVYTLLILSRTKSSLCSEHELLSVSRTKSLYVQKKSAMSRIKYAVYGQNNSDLCRTLTVV